MATPVIQAKNLRKSFKQHHVLKGIDFKVYEGEVIALLGENGAGKSTLIKIMNHLIKQSAGEITLFNHQPGHLEVKNRIGVMLQDNIILQRIKVKELLDLAGSYYDSHIPSSELLKIINSESLAEKMITQLSGGQKRKVNFALTLAGNPDLIFLDEPTASMDAKSRKDLWKIISNLKRQGKTIIVTSHYLEDLENIATRIFILQDGLIAFDGTLQELRLIQGEGTVSFNTNLKDDCFKDLQGVVSIHQQDDFYSLITQDVNAILKQLMPYLDQLSNITVQQTTLNHLLAYFKGENN